MKNSFIPLLSRWVIFMRNKHSHFVAQLVSACCIPNTELCRCSISFSPTTGEIPKDFHLQRAMNLVMVD